MKDWRWAFLVDKEALKRRRHHRENILTCIARLAGMRGRALLRQSRATIDALDESCSYSPSLSHVK